MLREAVRDFYRVSLVSEQVPLTFPFSLEKGDSHLKRTADFFILSADFSDVSADFLIPPADYGSFFADYAPRRLCYVNSIGQRMPFSRFHPLE